ncbi:aspartic proteinase from Irpex Lacteus [Panus rudis PR-1116 ss-1]|nr:aspartic proteinase from Irpex Lacteus [Panus rudis PR-1116 ss-1]
MLQRDQAHARGLRKLALAKLNNSMHQDVSLPSTTSFSDIDEFFVEVEIGSPPTIYALMVDTTTANTWVGVGKAYVRTSTSIQTQDSVAVETSDGSFSGTEFIDTVVFANLGANGVFGIGPRGLTEGTLLTNPGAIIPTFTDNLFAQGIIPSNQISMAVPPIASPNGELTFGGVDTTKFTGDLHFTPLTTTPPSSEFWGIEQAVQYGTSTPILPKSPGVVDTLITLTLFATEAFQRYKTATGAIIDPRLGLLRVSLSQFANMQSLFFTIAGFPFEFTPNAQIWPRHLNEAIGGQTNFVYLIIGDLGTPEGEGLDFVDSLTFLERYFAVFDTTNHRFGLATTTFTTSTAN